MYSSAYVWAKILNHMENRLTPAVVSTWFDDAEVVELNDEQLILYTASPFRKEIIQRRCTEYIKDAMKEIFNTEITLVVFGPEELAEYKARGKANTVMDFNPQFTFENFVVGSSNRFARSAAIAVANNPGQVYNPHFIYGPAGIGKTHLLYAIANELRRQHPDFKIVYIKGDQFTNELIAALQSGKNVEFRSKYREADLFLIDDIQFIAGKKQTQEEFFHTFNTLYESGRQIVLTSDRPPREMTQLEDRLQTRFEWGLMVDVAPPDFETRLAIIKNKAALLGVQLPDDISSFIAENLTANVRQIEGALNKLLAYRDLLGNQVDGEAVSRAVKDMLKKYNEFVPSPGLIVEYICRYYDVDEEQVRGQGRKRDLMEARQTAMYLIRRMTNLSLNDIGKEFGDRDHTTVLHSLDQVEKKMRSDPAYAERVKEITTNINNKK